MHENMIGGAALTNWLAILGVVSLLYWGWRIVAAFQHRRAGHREAASTRAVTVSAALVSAAPAESPDVSADDIPVIAAAVHAMLGAHRIVHLEATRSDPVWAAEGRWMQQTSHRPGRA